jgi:hypothetical protein
VLLSGPAIARRNPLIQAIRHPVVIAVISADAMPLPRKGSSGPLKISAA